MVDICQFHKDEVVVAPLQHLDRLGPVVGNRCADAELGQHLYGDLLIDGVVVDHENVGLVGKIECQRDDGGGIDDGRRHREGNPDGEGGAGTRGRSDLDVARPSIRSDACRWRARDRCLPNLRVVDASPWVKGENKRPNSSDFIPTPVSVTVNASRASFWGPRSRTSASVTVPLAVNLTRFRPGWSGSAAAARDRLSPLWRGHRGRNHRAATPLVCSRTPFFCAASVNKAGDVSRTICCGEKWNLFEFELTSFDLGEVEDVVDDRQQGLGAAMDGSREVLLLGGELGAEQEIGHAQHAVHGRADLVAHIGKELTLGAAGFLGGILGGGEFGDVFVRRNPAAVLSRRGCHRDHPATLETSNEFHAIAVSHLESKI